MGVIAEAAMTLRADDRKLKRGLSGALGSIRGFAGRAVSAIGPVAAGLAGLGAGIGLTAALGQGIKLAAEMEALQVSFETMLGSAEKAKQVIKELTEFSDVTPFEPEEVLNAGKSLLAFNTPAEEITSTLRALGDVAAGLNIPLGDLTEIYGKARVQGRLFMEDINQLTGRGIPIIGELAKQFGVAESEVRDLVSSGKVGFPELQRAFQDMTGEGGKFAGLMEKQSATTLGLVSTLKGRISGVLRGVGEALIEELNIKGGLAGVIDQVSNGSGRIIAIVRQVTRGVMSGVGTAWDFTKGVIREVGPVVMAWGRMIRAAFTSLWEVGKTVVSGIGQALSWLGETLGINLGHWASFKDGLIGFFTILETAWSNWRKVLELGFLGVWKAGVDFWDRIKDMFGNDIPAVLKFLAGNWKGVFTDIGTAMVTILKNASKKVSNLMTALWKTISTLGAEGMGDLKKAFTDALDPRDLLNGFKSSIPEGEIQDLLKTLGEVEQSDLSKSLEDQIDNLKRELEEDLQRRMARNQARDEDNRPEHGFDGDGAADRGVAMPAIPEPVLAQASRESRGGMVGLQDMWSKMQDAAMQPKEDPVQAQIVANGKKAAEEAERGRKEQEEINKHVEDAANTLMALAKKQFGFGR